ncbi:NADPH:quinone oxidoreductase family protein [uncultured Hyphomicrobium sp.]|uniref:NADPH:quinone oxidoreductase family protein n=1 Tax=uncultured Hyphomicrobium sp. TaxID=194373 RepID=UPI0025F4B599|nr:NADPH:quinone oxidoreductase family protein [uncultured Hyphomicrobium sp.]
MKAALCKSLDGPGAVVIEEIADPVPGPGEVVVRVRAAALNFFDTLITRGKYQTKPDLPFSPSGEVAGIVESLGPGVTGFKAGDRVAAALGYGGAREKVVVAAESLIPIPEGVSDTVASAVSVTFGTAIHGLKDRGRLQPGETVAILGASGGAGQAALEIAKLMGARVIAAAQGDKLDVCRAAGADEVVDYDAADLKQALKDLTHGRGVDVVYDCVGGKYAEPAVRALAWEGRFLVVGFAAGDIPRLPLNLLMLKGADAIGVFWGEAVRRNPEQHRANMIEVLGWVAAGKLAPRIHATYPLAGIRDAIGVLDRREATGKVVLTLDELNPRRAR